MAEKVCKKREFSDMEDLDLSFGVVGCGFTAKKRRRSIQIGENVSTASNSKPKPQAKASTSSGDSGPAFQRRSDLRLSLRGTLKRKVSGKMVRQKLKHFQDYSLPQQLARSDNFTVLRSISESNAAAKSPAKGASEGLKAKYKTRSQSETQAGRTGKGERALNFGRNPKRRQQDHDLQQKIDHEIKMREGTAKLLAASKHPAQVLEAAKNLLTSNTRIIAYMTELQKRKTAEVLGKQTGCGEGNQVPCQARVSISDLRIPLMWKDTDHFKNKGDSRRYSVFCLLKIGTEIYDTSMISNVDRSMTDISFDDVIVFNNVPHDFVCKVEVYCHKLHDDMSIANTPKKLRKKINDLSGSVGRSVGKRLSGLNDADVIGNMVLGPKFEMVAKGTLDLAHVDDSVRTFGLALEANQDGTTHELPLYDQYCCRLAALPHCLTEPAVTGFLNLQEDDDLSKWRRYWCVLKNLQLACWSSPTDVEVTQPLLSIPVTKNTQISDADPSTCKRPHAFLIRTCDRNGILEHILSAESPEDLAQWWDGFQQHLLDQALWKQACDLVMSIRPGSNRRSQVFIRKGSLYDETPIHDSSKEEGEGSVLKDLEVDEAHLNQMLTQLMGEADQIRTGQSRHQSTS